MLVSIVLTACLSSCVFAKSTFTVGGFAPKPFRAPSEHVVTPNVLELTRTQGSRSHPYIHALLNRDEVNGEFGVTPITGVAMSQVFLAKVKFGKQTFQAVIDTGSSDTWLAEKNFLCFNVTTAASVPEADCFFGTPYTLSKTFKQIPNENFNITYASGEMLVGIVGTESVTIAGITVQKQEVGVVNHAAWFGDGISSGLIGLAFPALTSAYAGTDPSVDSAATQEVYNPVFTNMYTEGEVAPLFSLAIDRGNQTGKMAIGGIPSGLTLGPFSSTPFQVLTMKSASTPSAKPKYQFYTIDVDFVFPGSEDAKIVERAPAKGAVQTIVDSGTTLLFAPTTIADKVNSMFVPPAVFDPNQGAYVVACNAKAPAFGVKVNKTVFTINPLDLILPNGDGTCISGIDDAGSSFSILGDVFLKSVLAVFDVGAAEMRFAARTY